MKKLKTTLVWWVAITAITIGLCHLTQIIADLFGIELPDQANLDLVKNSAGWNLKFLGLCVYIVCITPAIEEFLFRYLCWKVHKPQREWSLAILSAALFSAAHYLFQPFPDNAFIALFAFGMMQCALYKRTGAIWCPIVSHALFNAVNLVLLFALPPVA